MNVAGTSAMLGEATASGPAASAAAGWSAVFALSLCVATLIASEFMPVSLLTPVATDLHLTNGQAGQAISVSGIFAVVTSLSLASIARRVDRRNLLLGLTALMLISGVVVAFAPTFSVLVGGRALLGIVIGGFWSMSTATVMRLVSQADVPKALALLNGGNALATTIAAPLGSFLGQFIGWRGAFFAVVPLAALCLAWQFFSLPTMPADIAKSTSTFAVLRRPHIVRGMLAIALFYTGQFALFTYLRPFLETATHVGTSTLSLMLLALGVAGLVGTSVIGLVIQNRIQALLIAMPIVMAAIAASLVVAGSSTAATVVLLSAWGFIGTAAPVAWWTWLSRTLPDDAEAGGGLMVAVIQLAITLGAACGGLFYDRSGYPATFILSAVLLCGSGLIALTLSRKAVSMTAL